MGGLSPPQLRLRRTAPPAALRASSHHFMGGLSPPQLRPRRTAPPPALPAGPPPLAVGPVTPPPSGRARITSWGALAPRSFAFGELRPPPPFGRARITSWGALAPRSFAFGELLP